MTPDDPKLTPYSQINTPHVSQNSLVTPFSFCTYFFGLPSTYRKPSRGTFVVSPKFVPKARRQELQWQSEVRAASGDSRSTL